MSESSGAGPSSSTTPNEERTTSDLVTTLPGTPDHEVNQNNVSNGCCDFTTRKFSSLAWVAFIFAVAVIFLVAAKVETDNKGISIDDLPVHRYLTIVLAVSVVWMATSIIIPMCPSKPNWLKKHTEPMKALVPTNLLIGVMFFGLGSSFMTMVEFIEYLAKYDCPSKDPTMLLFYIVRTLFIYTQLYFFYKLSRDNKEKLLIFSHFLMMHLIAVNLGTWLVTFVYDSAEELNDDNYKKAAIINGSIVNSSMVFMIRHRGVNLTSHKNVSGCEKTVETLKSTAKTMEPYLYTFTMEYCLISAGLLLNAWRSLEGPTTRAKERDNAEHGQDSSGTCLDRNGYEILRDGNGRKRYTSSNGGRSSRRQQQWGEVVSESDQGFMSDESYVHVEDGGSIQEVGTLWRFGFIAGLAYIPAFTAIIFNMLFSDDLEQDRLIYIGMQFFFFLSIFLASLSGIWQLEKQKQNKGEHSQVDFVLLGVALVGVMLLDFLIIVASVCEGKESPAIAIFLIVTNVTELLCSVVFALFVRKALQHKYVPSAEKPNEEVLKSASRIREVVSFLFMLNLCFWALYTFEVKKSNTVLAMVEQFYTKKVWFYLSHIVYPLAVFFHFHGAVCMVEVLGNFSYVSKPDKIITLSSQSTYMPQPAIRA